MHLLFNSPYCRKFLFKLPSTTLYCTWTVQCNARSHCGDAKRNVTATFLQSPVQWAEQFLDLKNCFWPQFRVIVLPNPATARDGSSSKMKTCFSLQPHAIKNLETYVLLKRRAQNCMETCQRPPRQLAQYKNFHFTTVSASGDKMTKGLLG